MTWTFIDIPEAFFVYFVAAIAAYLGLYPALLIFGSPLNNYFGIFVPMLLSASTAATLTQLQYRDIFSAKSLIALGLHGGIVGTALCTLIMFLLA